MKSERQEFIENLYRHMREELFLSAVAILHDHDLAEEAVQQVFCDACKANSSIYGHPNPEGWLHEALRFTALNMLRKQATARSVFMKTLLNEESYTVENFLPLAILYPGIDKLPEYSLLVRYVLRGYSYEQLAREEGDFPGHLPEACGTRQKEAESVYEKEVEKR